MGGDRAPDEVVAGAGLARAREVEPILYGRREVVEALADGLRIVHAPDVVGMDEKPGDAARAKRSSSLFAACRAVSDGVADVALSAGNTGALLAAGLVEIGRLPGVHRPAIAVPLPALAGPTVLIDGGANADARPEHLLQFAHMGAVFAAEALGVRDPSVALLSIGEEPEKGNRLVREAHELLAEGPLRYVGNVEGRDLLRGSVDVVVCDGFTGNVALKTLEGGIGIALSSLREEIASTWRGKAGGLLVRPAARRLRARLDPETYGGAYLLGLRGLVVIAHGNSSARAIANAIGLAARGVEGGVVERVGARLAGAAVSAGS
ncbi:MAG: phosphate acyltransferase PlsX [Thermoleophilia bacterium]|nr:phosphate acyltransferase PlsX [Thermoleophilia bacterium]